MAVVHTIATQLTAATTNFEAGMKKASGTIKSFVGEFGSIGKIASGITLANVVEGLASKLKQLTIGQFEVIDANAKLSDRLGVSMEKLAGLQLAADLAGVSSEELGNNLSRLQKGIGEAANKGGELDDLLTRLGLPAKELASIPLDQALSKIAEAVNKIENPSQRAAAATELFGKAGMRMINVLAGGEKGFAEAAAEAQKFGLAVSRIDAAKVEAANDAMTRVGAVLKGIGTTLAIEISPLLEFAANQFTKWASSGDGVRANIIGIFESGAKAISFFGQQLGSLQALWIQLQIGANAFGKAIIDAVATAVNAIAALGTLGITEFMGFDAAEFAGIKDASDAYAVELEVLQGKLNKLGRQPDVGKEILAFFRNLRTEADAAGKKIADAAGGAGKLAENLQKAGKFAIDLAKDLGFALQKELQTPFEKMQEEIAKLQDQLAFNIIDPELFERGLAKAFKDFEGAMPKPLDSGPSAKLRGSKEAFDAIDKFNRRGEQKDIGALIKLAQEQNVIARRQAKEIGAEVAKQIGIQPLGP